MLNNKAPGPALRTPYGPGADPLATVTKEQVLMGHATHPPHPQPTPVADDAHASVAQLHQRAAADYQTAQARREQLSREDRTGGGN